MASEMIEREEAALKLEERAAALEQKWLHSKAQRHSGLPATEEELASAKFAARQLRIAADDLRNEL